MALQAMRVPTVFTAVDRFSNVIDKMTRKTSMFGKTAEGAALRTSTRLNSIGTSMLAGGLGMAAGIGLAVNESMKFEKSISNISTLTKNTPEQMKAIGDSILDASTKIPVAISDLTEGMYDVVSAGIEGTAHQLDVLNRSGRLAVAGLGTTKEAVNITTSALNAFGKEAGTAYQVTNLLMKAVKYGKTTVSGISESFGSFASIMKNSGVTLQEYLASTTALTTAGMTMSRAQTQVSSATIALIKPNSQMLKIYKKLGVKDIPEFIKANGGLVNTLDLVGKTGKGMGLMLSKVFGRKEGLSAYLSLIGALSPKFKEIMNDMTSGADMVNEAFAKQQKTFSAQFQIMKNKVVGLGIAIGNELMPRISGFVDTISPIISGTIAWIKNNEWLATAILNVTASLLALGALAKIGAFLFLSYARVLKIYRYASLGVLWVVEKMSLAMLLSAETGASLSSVLYGMAAPTLAWLIPLSGVVAVLGIIAWSMDNSSVTSNRFAQDKKTHFAIVSGAYETMEQRIARSNDRIVANMKKLKMDLESVKKTGKTIAELRGEQGTKATRSFELDKFKANVGKSSSALKVMPNRLIMPKIISDSDQAFNDIMNERKNKNLAGARSENLVNDITKKINKQQVEVIIKDPGNNAESVKVNGKNYFGGLGANTGSTTGVPSF